MPETTTKRASRIPLAGRALWVCIALAIALRVGGAIYQGNSVRALPGIADQISYHELAVRVLDGHGFTFAVGWWPATPAGRPTAHWSFLYVMLLAALYSVAGPNALAARLAQAIVTAILQTYLTYRIGSRLFGARAGVVSAALTAINAYFIYYSGALMTESLYIVCLLWIVDAATKLADPLNAPANRMRAGAWAFLGLAMGAAALLRQTILLVVPLILVWLVWRTAPTPAPARGTRLRYWLRQSRYPALAAAVMLACIAPCTIRNYHAFGRFVLLNTNAGFAFFWANHPIHQTEFIPILQADQPTYGSLIPAELRGLDEAQMDRALLVRGIGFASADPLRYLRLSMSRAKEYFRFWPGPQSGSLSNYARSLSFGVLLPFLASGVLLALVVPRRLPGYREEAAPLISFVLLVSAAYTLVHLLSWALIRYRLPVDAIMTPFAAASMLTVADWILGVRRAAASRAYEGASL